MRVGIDGWYLRKQSGLGSYVRSLVSALAQTRSLSALIVYVPRGDDVVSHLPKGEPVNVRFLPSLPYPLWEQVLIPFAARRDRLDVLHSPANTGPLHLHASTRLVMTVHDAIFMLPSTDWPASPAMYQRAGQSYRRFIVPRAIRRAHFVLTGSDHCAADLRSVLHNPRMRLRVIYPAHASHFRPLGAAEAARDLPGAASGLSKFILAFGATDPRKNLERILAAFNRYCATDSEISLVLVGNIGAVRNRLQGAKSSGRIVVLHNVTDNQLVALYSSAALLLYPSLYEGFGLPVLEALACGTPVIASRRSSIPEIAGLAAEYVEPTDISDLVRALRLVLHDVVVREQLVTAGLERARRFSWPRTARLVLKAYQDP